MINYYTKYNKYIEKYKLLINNQIGGNENIKLTYYININNHTDSFGEHSIDFIFTKELKKELSNRNYIESSNFPVDFIFLSGEPAWYRNKFDTKKSKCINLLYGKSATNITNKILLHNKYKDMKFIIHADYINENTLLSDIISKLKNRFIKILKPLGSYSGTGNKIVRNKKQIKDWIQENTKYKEWLLEDYIIEPDLKNGYKFHFRIPLLIKVFNKKINIYISKKYYYQIAKQKYKKSDWLNKDIHDTHFSGDNIVFPNEYPDNWNEEDANLCSNKIQNIIQTVFRNNIDFRPGWDALNGFDVYGVDIIFEKKQPYLLEINDRAGLIPDIIPDMLSVVLDNKENGFKKLI
jgi:hypothetical protein